MHHTLNQWPDKRDISKTLKPYYAERSSLSVNEGLLLKDSRLVIPATLRPDILRHLHDGHQGMTKTKENAANSVWWPGLLSDIDKMVQTCPECAKFRRARIEPMKGTPFPRRCWSVIASDFFYLDGKQYILAIDYFSRDIEVHPVTRANTAETIEFLKSVYARHGIADVLISDNGPQYDSEEFSCFSDSWGFEHVTSSPQYPQANGEAERAVQTIKGLMKKCDDFYLSLLMYRNANLHNGFSPAQLSMGRRLKTRVPCLPESLLPQIPDMDLVRKREKDYREQSKFNYDRRHRVVAPEHLSPGDTVWIPDRAKEGTVLRRHEAPRSLIIKTSNGAVLRRNQQMTRKLHFPSYHQTPPPLHSQSFDPADSSLTPSPTRANPQSLARSSPASSAELRRDAGGARASVTPPGTPLQGRSTAEPLMTSTTPGQRTATSTSV